MKKTLSQKFGADTLVIELDKSEVYPSDPGRGTPAMVKLMRGNREIDNGTYWCAIGEEELSYNGTRLTEPQVNWLNQQDEIITNFLYR